MLADRFPALSPLDVLRLRRADHLIVTAAHNYLTKVEKAQRKQQGQED